jgi:hypothetical protein
MAEALSLSGPRTGKHGEGTIFKGAKDGNIR